MTEIRFKFDLAFSRRFLVASGAAVMMLCAVPELDSESVTLSTYYPAPSGVYTQMITTGNTYLARDGGGVGVGTTAPGAVKLYVRDSDNDADADIARFFANNLTQGIGIGYNRIEAVGSNANQDILLMPKGSGNVGIGSISGEKLHVNGSMRVSGDSNVAGGNVSVTAAAGVGGSVSAEGVLQTKQGLSGCFDVSHTYPAAPPGLPGGGVVTLCPGRYVTMTDGIYTKKTVMVVVPGAAQLGYTIDARCCNCPPGGCGGM